MSHSFIFATFMHQVVFGSLLFLILFCLHLLLDKRGGRKYSYFIWMSFFILLLVPVRKLFIYLGKIFENPVESLTYITIKIPSQTNILERHAFGINEAQLTDSLILLWLLGLGISSLLILVIPLLKDVLEGKKIISQSREMQNLVPDILKRRKVKIYVSSLPISPQVRGVLRSKIIIPQKVFKELNSHQQKAIILHEAAHVLQFDLLKLFYARVVMVIFWCFPPVYWVYQKLIEGMEYNADEFSLGIVKNRREYGEALLRVAQWVDEPFRQKISLSLISKHHLTRRLEMIKMFRKNRKNPFYIFIMGMVLSVSVVALAATEKTTELGEYVTIVTVMKKDGKIIAKPAVITRLGGKAGIRSFYSGYLSDLNLALREVDDNLVEISGTYCDQAFSENEAENYMDSANKFECLKEIQFAIVGRYNQKLKLQIMDNNKITFKVFRGAHTERVLKGFDEARKEEALQTIETH